MNSRSLDQENFCCFELIVRSKGKPKPELMEKDMAFSLVLEIQTQGGERPYME